VVSAADTGVNVVIATNTVLGSTQAIIDGGSATTNGPSAHLIVRADSEAMIVADVRSEVQAATSVGIVLAFNTIGHRPTNLLFNIANTFAGTDLGGVDPASTVARVDGALLNLAGDMRILAQWDGNIAAQISSSALALQVKTPNQKNDDDDKDQESITVAPVIALNRIATTTEAVFSASVDSVNTVGGTVSVTTGATTAISAKLASSAVSIAADLSGGNGANKSVSVGAIFARNEIDSAVTATITGNQAPSLLASSGHIRVSAEDRTKIDAEISATSIAVSAGQGAVKAISLGANFAHNFIDSTARSSIAGFSRLVAGGDLSVDARRTADIRSISRSVAISFALSLGNKDAAAVAGGGGGRGAVGAGDRCGGEQGDAGAVRQGFHTSADA